MEGILGSKETNTVRKKRWAAKYYLLISLFSSTSLLVMQGSPIPYPTRHHNLYIPNPLHYHQTHKFTCYPLASTATYISLPLTHTTTRCPQHP